MVQVVKDSELHRIVVTAIIYNSEGKYLITKRAPNKKVQPNKWTVPGGGMEPSDYVDTPKTTSDAWYYAIETTLRREVMEEVNLEIENLQFLLDLVFIRPDGIPVIVLSYYASYKSGDVVLEEGDTTEYKWVTAEKAKEYDLVSGILDEIHLVDDILNKTNKYGNPLHPAR